MTIEIAVLCLVILGAMFFLLLAIRESHFRRVEERESPPTANWQCYQYGGGGKVDLIMTRVEAIAYVSRHLGPVTYVDDIAHFIFYKPFGGYENSTVPMPAELPTDTN